MIWDELIGQRPAKSYLRMALNSRRLAHAYLFSGPAGVGKRTAAYLFAQAAMCHNPAAPDEPCGSCKSCRWFAAREGARISHPDVIGLMTFGKEAAGQEGGGNQRTEKLVGDHDAVIKLESIQHVCEQLHRSPMNGPRRA